MAWSEAKAWTRGKATGKIYQDLLDDATNAPARNARRNARRKAVSDPFGSGFFVPE